MSAMILPFPGIDPNRIKPRPATIADLPEGAKALVITAKGARFKVALAPAVTASERKIWQTFPTPDDARHFARLMSIAFPRLYQLIVDELPDRGAA